VLYPLRRLRGRRCGSPDPPCQGRSGRRAGLQVPQVPAPDRSDGVAL